MFGRIVFQREKPPFFIFLVVFEIKKEVTQNCPQGRSISLQLFCLIFQIWYWYLSICLLSVMVKMQPSICLTSRAWGTFRVQISRKKLIYPSRWYILWQQKNNWSKLSISKKLRHSKFVFFKTLEGYDAFSGKQSENKTDFLTFPACF